MFSRRQILLTSAALASAAFARRAGAAQALEVAVVGNALGAIVAAEGGGLVKVVVDRTLGPVELRIGGVVHAVGGARTRPDLLDDPRNAPRVGAAVRKLLAAADPAHAAEFDRNHKAWTHAFVRKVLAWNARLQSSPVRGKRLADSQRAALLEWAGAVVDPAGAAPPAALARAPRDAAAATLDSYAAYIDALVASLA